MSLTILPLAQMSIKSAIIIIFITILRKVFLFRFPKRVFLSLWMIAITRLLVPLSVSAAFIPRLSLYHTWESNQIPLEQPYLPAHSNMAVNNVPPANGTNSPLSMWSILWVVGAILVALCFLIAYVISHLKFSESISIENKDAELWLSQHPLRRSIQIRACTHVTSPLTYGIFRPTILFPMDMDFSQTTELHFILQHEYTHIKYFHGAMKLLIVVCLCLHWFNPTVWVLYFLANKDMELFCDEMVLQEHNGKAKTAYAHTLIHMSMGTAANLHLHNNFSERALKERIMAIMKHKKYSILSLLLALVLAVSVTCIAFASTSTPIIVEDGDPVSMNTTDVIVEDGTLVPVNGSEVIVDYAPISSNSGISPLASGAIFPNDDIAFNEEYMRSGQTVTISIRYTPTSAPLNVGVQNAVTGRTYTQRVTGGRGNAVINIPTSGTYKLYIKNLSSDYVDAQISYMLST